MEAKPNKYCNISSLLSRGNPKKYENWDKFMFYPLDIQNTRKLKTKTKLLSFYKQQSYFSQIVSKKNRNNKIPKILFWVLVFSFMYLVSVYPTNRTICAKVDGSLSEYPRT